MNRLKSQLHFLHVLKDAKPQASRTLLVSTDDDLIKAIVECAINTLNGNPKLPKDEKSKLNKFKNCLHTLIDPKIIFKCKRKRLIKKGGLLLHCSEVFCRVLIGTLINNN